MNSEDLHKSRNRIAGKKYTPEEYPAALKAAILGLIAAGDTSPNSIAGKLGKDRTLISKKIHEYAQAGDLELTESGRVPKIPAIAAARSFEALSDEDFIAKNPEVLKWIEDMKTRGKNGAMLADASALISGLRYSCKVLKVNPSAFAVSREINEKLLTELRAQLKIITPDRRSRGWMSYTQSIRNFAQSMGTGWARNMAPAIASGKKVNYGAYSKLFATDDQREGIMQYASRFSTDLKIAIWFGMEASTPRDATLRAIKVAQVHFRQRAGFEIAELEVYERKTETYWPKQLFDPRVVKALKAHIATKSPSSFLFGNGEPITRQQLAEALRECYRSVGIDVESDGDEKMINYWKAKPIHSMRHSTETMWMRRSGMNPLLVAKMSHSDVNMITQVYANMGIEEAWNAGRCDFCKPDPSSQGDAHYDGWKCAVAGLNQRFGN